MSESSNAKNVKFISLDVVFYGSSLNYDWGEGNYQELKKITKWDGRQYVLVSRYALRYSILHWANKLFPEKWKLAGRDELWEGKEKEVPRLRYKGELERTKYQGKSYKDFLKEIFENFPEFDLFGFMIAKKGSEEPALTRVSPVKISHAISLTPTNLDAHTIANLDIVRRAGKAGSNPVTIEEKADFYVYNVTIDVERVGKYLESEHGMEEIGDIKLNNELAQERILQLIETVLNLKRDIKGRREDLSPWFVVLGIYKDGRYETFMDKIRLERKTHYKVKRTYKKEGDTEIIENEIEEGLMPLFVVDLPNNTNNLWIYYREGFCDFTPRQKGEKILKTKEEIIEKVKEFLETGKAT